MQTLYSCKFFEFVDDHDLTVVGFLPPTHPNVHHVDLFECDLLRDTVSTFPTEPSDCFALDFFKDCMGRGNLRFASGGGQGDYEYLPKDVGLPVGAGGHSILVLQLHTEQLSEPEDLSLDDLGLDLILSPTPRQFEPGYFQFGYDLQQLLIPGLVEDYTVIARMLSDCTRRAFPKEGVTVTAVNFHTHTYGTSLVLDVVRFDTGQIERIGSNDNFDHHKQMRQSLVEPVVVRPGDEMVLSVNFTNETPNLVWGSMMDKDEMALVGIRTFPSINASYCQSGFLANFARDFEPTFTNFLKAAHDVDPGTVSYRKVGFGVDGVSEVWDTYMGLHADTLSGDNQIFQTQCFDPVFGDEVASLATVLEPKVPMVMKGKCGGRTRMGLHNMPWVDDASSVHDDAESNVADGTADEGTPTDAADEPDQPNPRNSTIGATATVFGVGGVVVLIAGVVILVKHLRQQRKVYVPVNE